MKNLVCSVVALFALLVVGCSDDDDPTQPGGPQGLEGTWSLINVTGSIAGGSHDFEEGTITWDFDESEGTVTVVNNNDDEQVEDFFESGTYDYDYEANEISNTCNETLVAENTDLGCKHTEGDTLTLTQVVADGYVLTFIR